MFRCTYYTSESFDIQCTYWYDTVAQLSSYMATISSLDGFKLVSIEEK